MSEIMKFRTALNGFHRADVAAYIESSSSAHEKALAALREEKARLQQDLQQAQSALDAKDQQLKDLEQQLEETKTALAATESSLEEAMELLTAEPEPTPEEAPEAETPAPEEEPADYSALELEAYRRAESMERLSAERAARMKSKLNELLEQVSSRYEQTGLEIQALSDDIHTNLQRLEESLTDLDTIFDETSRSFEDMDSTEEL